MRVQSSIIRNAPHCLD